jgi:hypothetical protein
MEFLFDEDIIINNEPESNSNNIDFDNILNSYKSNNTDIFKEIEYVVTTGNYQDQIYTLSFKIVMQELLLKKYKPAYEWSNRFSRALETGLKQVGPNLWIA